MSKSPFISRDRSFGILTAAVWATAPVGEDLWCEDGRRACEDAEQWFNLIDDLQAGTIGLEEFSSRIEDLPWMGSNLDLAVERFVQYETQRGVWGRYQARQALRKAAHKADTTSLGDLLRGAVRMARESRHAA